MELRCGTSGFSFKEWKGPFYPAKLPADQMLGSYAERLPTVEINNTFYRMPRKDVIAAWREQVPADFRFVIKASRRISHILRLKDCEEPAKYLFEAVAELGERLGAVLVQLPPHFRVDVERLESFLELVPERIPVAFEFRHESWNDDAVRAALASRDAAYVVADNDGTVPAELLAAAKWAYLRLRAPEYPAAKLRAWRKRLELFERAYVFFKHEAKAAGPKLAEKMQRL